MGSVNNTSIWRKESNNYWPANTAAQLDKLPGGIYRYQKTMFGWHMENINHKFTFSYKIYGNNQDKLSRIITAWEKIDTSIGVLFNGIKGSGKTVTAQLICNWAVDNNIPVILVDSPIPLEEIIPKLNQEAVIFFDEFEKIYEKKEDQQKILTIIDGTAKSVFKRLFIFTTNNKRIDENLIDRPSRIRYSWDFDRLSEDTVQELIKDILDPELIHLKDDLSSYLLTRNILSIDTVKTAIQEVNIFKESPFKFKDILNISDKPPVGWIVELLDHNRQIIKPLAEFFNPKEHKNLFINMNSSSGREEIAKAISIHGGYLYLYHRSFNFKMIRPTEINNEWIGNLYIDISDTWIYKIPGLMNRFSVGDKLGLDSKPKDWQIPDWAVKLKKLKDVDNLESIDFENLEHWESAETIFGGKISEVILRFTQNKSSIKESYEPIDF